MTEENTVEFVEDDILSLDAPRSLDAIISRAVNQQASDVFFIAQQGSYSVTLRRLGTIKHIVSVPREQGMLIVNLIKTHAGMDLGEKRRPRDGRWSHDIDGQIVDFRVNSIGTQFGEDLALRLFDRKSCFHDLNQLGFVGNQLSKVKSMLDNPHGLILVTGPTGSGKTTTLYSCLQYLNNGRRKINTLEDPIEFTFKGICQSQVFAKQGLDFSDLLRGAMRQSADVVMVGEIRDEETAQTAVCAASGGHLVLSSLHASVSSGVVQSMLAFGVHPYFLANCLLGVVSQRLVRKLNPETRVEFDLSHSPETFANVKQFLTPDQGKVIYAASPNDSDSREGYVGQSGLFEVLEICQELRELVSQSRPSAELRHRSIELGMLDFHQSALIKVAQGVTSTEEIVYQVPVDDVSTPPPHVKK